jgi:hypothetical protein
MGRMKNNLIELIIDKAALAVAVIIALLILFIFVIGSPNAVKYAGEKLAPGKIDKSINTRAAKLQEKLKEEPQDSNSYKSQSPLYLSYIKNAIKDVNVNISFPLPHYSTETDYIENRVYQLPTIGQIANTSIANVTMVGFVPIEELSDALTYNQVETELVDIDLVTVESSINAKQLYESFEAAFTGKKVPDEWKNEQHAKPIFAKVELQRKILQKDGSWNQWAEVPKTKIYYLDKTLQIPTQTNEYEIQIAMVQFSKPEIRNEILQPPVYVNAIPAEPWLSPSFYNEREKRLKKEQEELKKQQLEAEKAQRLQGRVSRVRQSAVRQRTPQTPFGSSSESDESDTPSATPQPQRTTRPQTPTRQPPQRTSASTKGQEQTLTEEQQFIAVRLTEQTDPATLEKLVFWAHDDTTKPGEKYQYRIRIGILNPIAGKNWFSQEQKDLQGQIILFSSFSEPTDTVEIPERIHFFATNSRETEKGYFVDKTAEVKVARYTLGNWATKTFTVKNGDKIGTVVNTAETRLKQTGIPTESIDLSTGFIMVDVRRVTEWVGTGSLKPREFYELLYCKTGEPIQTMPIKERYWPEEITKTYKEIEEAEATEPIVLLGRTESISGGDVRNIKRPAPSESRPTGESEGQPRPSFDPRNTVENYEE